jgi:hypothetical protein
MQRNSKRSTKSWLEIPYTSSHKHFFGPSCKQFFEPHQAVQYVPVPVYINQPTSYFEQGIPKTFTFLSLHESHSFTEQEAMNNLSLEAAANLDELCMTDEAAGNAQLILEQQDFSIHFDALGASEQTLPTSVTGHDFSVIPAASFSVPMQDSLNTLTQREHMPFNSPPPQSVHAMVEVSSGKQQASKVCSMVSDSVEQTASKPTRSTVPSVDINNNQQIFNFAAEWYQVTNSPEAQRALVQVFKGLSYDKKLQIAQEKRQTAHVKLQIAMAQQKEQEEKPQLVQTPNQKRKSEVSVPIDNCAIPTSPTFKKQRTSPTEKRNKKEGPVCTEEQSSVSATLVDPTVEDDAPFNEKEIKDNYNKLLVFMCAYEQVCFTLF